MIRRRFPGKSTGCVVRPGTPIVPRLLASTLAAGEKVRILELPIDLPSYSVKQHWHERFHLDPASLWLRNTLFELFSKPGDPAPV